MCGLVLGKVMQSYRLHASERPNVRPNEWQVSNMSNRQLRRVGNNHSLGN